MTAKRHAGATILIGSLLAFLALHCKQQQKDGAETRAADEAAIRQADIAMSRTGETKDLEAQLMCLTEDEILMPPNTPMIVGNERS